MSSRAVLRWFEILPIPTRLLFRCAAASHNNKSHCFSAKNSSLDYFSAAVLGFFSHLETTLSNALSELLLKVRSVVD